MARIKTDIMVWSKAFLSKCKLQKWNFVTKPPHGGSETEKYREKAAGDFLLDITVYFIADKYSNIWKCYGCEDGCRVSGMLVSGRSFCYDGKYTSQSGAELFVWH